MTRSRTGLGSLGVGGGCGAPGAAGLAGGALAAAGLAAGDWAGDLAGAGLAGGAGATPGDGVVCRASAVAATGGAEGGAEAVEGTGAAGVGDAAPGLGFGAAGCEGTARAVGLAAGTVGDSADALATGGRRGPPPPFKGGRNGAGRTDAPAADFVRRGIVGTAEEEGFGKSILLGRARSRVGSSNSGKGLDSDFDSPPRRFLICSMVPGSTELE